VRGGGRLSLRKLARKRIQGPLLSGEESDTREKESQPEKKDKSEVKCRGREVHKLSVNRRRFRGGGEGGLTGNRLEKRKFKPHASGGEKELLGKINLNTYVGGKRRGA